MTSQLAPQSTPQSPPEPTSPPPVSLVPPPGGEGKTFFGQPRGLATLFFTEMWERFSFYGMKALLMLFMTAGLTAHGLGFDKGKAGAIYGLYGAGVYLTAMPGGWLADKLLGQRRAVLVGGVIIAAGHFCMALPGTSSFFLGMLLIVLGTGLLKPNISAMVGGLYPEGGSRRDAGFSIFYMGINVGVTFAPLVVGYVGERINWHLGFGIAGVGMVLGLVQYVVGARHLKDVGAPPPHSAEAWRAMRGVLAGVAVLAGVLAALHFMNVVDLTSAVGLANVTGGVISALALAFFGYMFTAGGLDAAEKKRLAVIGVFFLCSTLFWAGFEQAGSSFNLFADEYTDRFLFGIPVPASFFLAVNGFFILTLAPAFAWLWLWLNRRGREPSSPAKFSAGLMLLGGGFLTMVAASLAAAGGHKVSPLWLVLTYLMATFGELSLSPVGLSTVTKLAPQRTVGQMMGVWFMSMSLGNLIAGRVAGQFEAMPLPQLFGIMAAVSIGSGVLLALFVRPLKRMMGGVN